MQDHECRILDVPLWRQIKLMDGRVATWLAVVMPRRLPDGSWQYREMTDSEKVDERRNLPW